MAIQKSKSYYVNNGPNVNITPEITWTIGAIVLRGTLLQPGVDIDEVTYETVDKNGNILDTQTATLSIQKKRGAKCD